MCVSGNLLRPAIKVPAQNRNITESLLSANLIKTIILEEVLRVHKKDYSKAKSALNIRYNYCE